MIHETLSLNVSSRKAAFYAPRLHPSFCTGKGSRPATNSITTQIRELDTVPTGMQFAFACLQNLNAKEASDSTLPKTQDQRTNDDETLDSK